MKYKPLIASFIVIAVAIGGMAIWSAMQKPGRGAANNAPSNAPVADDGSEPLQYTITKFEDLPALDPLGLWPRDNARSASPLVWIMWETAGESQCRLLGTRDRRDWYVLGNTSGRKHFLQANLGFFDSADTSTAMTFAVEFEAGGKRYRSAPRTVLFGKGAAFGQRRYKYALGAEKTPTWDLELTGRTATELGAESFLTVWFGEGVSTFAVPKSADTVAFGLDGADALKSGVSGFLEVYDARNQTYDRVLIELTR